jgi:hypothetical protein
VQDKLADADQCSASDLALPHATPVAVTLILVLVHTPRIALWSTPHPDMMCPADQSHERASMAWGRVLVIGTCVQGRAADGCMGRHVQIETVTRVVVNARAALSSALTARARVTASYSLQWPTAVARYCTLRRSRVRLHPLCCMRSAGRARIHAMSRPTLVSTQLASACKCSTLSGMYRTRCTDS